MDVKAGWQQDTVLHSRGPMGESGDQKLVPTCDKKTEFKISSCQGIYIASIFTDKPDQMYDEENN